MMPEKSQKRKLRSDQSSSQENVEISSHVTDKNTALTERDFSDLTNKIENRLSRRLRDTEFGQKEILRLIENNATKVDSLSNPTSERSGSALRYELHTEPVDDPGTSDSSRNVGSNKCEDKHCRNSKHKDSFLKETASAMHYKQTPQLFEKYFSLNTCSRPI